MQKGKPIIQPDFQSIFFDHFGSKPRRHRYELRFGTSNLHHDVIFLGSLIHDARFTRVGIQLRKGKIKIPIERDTWEVGTLVRENASELHYCKSELTFSGVKSVEWRFTGSVAAESDELWIGDLILRKLIQRQDYYEFVMSGRDWEVLIVLEEDIASIMLRDKETPISHATAPKANG
jgi:hypothetical protein